MDTERGCCGREDALEEMDRIEVRRKELIEEIRSVAGQMSHEEEVGAASGDGAFL